MINITIYVKDDSMCVECAASVSRHRWENNIKMDLREIGWEVVDHINLAKDKWQTLVNMVMNF
jgi:hypothetical protein